MAKEQEEKEDVREKMLTAIKELFEEWVEESQYSNGMLFLRPELVAVDILEAVGLNDKAGRAFLFGQGEE